MSIASPCRSLLALVMVLACAPDAASPCYAPASYSYRGEVREVGRLPNVAESVIALPDGRAFAVVIDDYVSGTFVYRGFLVDPAGGAVDEVAGWQSGFGSMTRLADGRVLRFDNHGCGYVLIDLDASGAVAAHTCATENFSAEIVWQDPAGRLFVFGEYYPGGNDPEGAVYTLDLAGATLTKLDTRTEYGFRAPPDQPFPLCDGRLLFPHTELDGGDFTDEADAVHYFDPATGELTSLALPFRPAYAAQLDATSALLLAASPGYEPRVHLFDLETGESRAIDPPAGLSLSWLDEPLMGLADGTALVVGQDRAIHTFSLTSESWATTGVQFAGKTQRLLRLATGPVLAFAEDGRVEIYE